MPRIRDWLRRDRSRDVSLGRFLARLAAKLVFLALAVVFLAISVSGTAGLAFIFAILAAQFMYILIPVQDVRARAKRLWTGEAGEDAYDATKDRAGGWFK